MAVNSSMLDQSQKNLQQLARERKHQNPLLSLLSLPLQSRSPEMFSFPTTIFSCSQGTAKNVIKATSVICHAALTVGSLAFSMESSIVSSCYWTRIKSAFACSFLCSNNVRLFTRLTEDLASPCGLSLLHIELHAQSSSSGEGCLICIVLIFKALVEPVLSLGELEKTWTGHQKTWVWNWSYLLHNHALANSFTFPEPQFFYM